VPIHECRRTRLDYEIGLPSGIAVAELGVTAVDQQPVTPIARLRRAAATRLARFVTGDGAVRFAVPALIAAASV
jgi:hypothetical protein